MKDIFYPELSASQTAESLNKFFKRNFNAKTSLILFISKFDQTMESLYEKEVREDLASLYSKPPLKTPSPIENQAAHVYTNQVFEKFQEEFVESLGYYVEKIEDGAVWAVSTDSYKVAKVALQKALTEVVTAKFTQKKGQQNLQRFARLQKLQYKVPLPKLHPKKALSRGYKLFWP
ncbi:hypothetical protein HPP92_009593 [Vanilla planifolia]|uniref:Protein FAR1-RELATED SEQUENCE n=1 Tax=Vanilla planifolia TaxID=51239 RepID=A0A835V301_VANPL|nr:hypothetical protein HPP92_009593 [Vanilla planifolia]